MEKEILANRDQTRGQVAAQREFFKQPLCLGVESGEPRFEVLSQLVLVHDLPCATGFAPIVSPVDRLDSDRFKSFSSLWRRERSFGQFVRLFL